MNIFVVQKIAEVVLSSPVSLKSPEVKPYSIEYVVDGSRDVEEEGKLDEEMPLVLGEFVVCSNVVFRNKDTEVKVIFSGPKLVVWSV